MAHGVQNVPGAVRTRRSLTSGTVDSGVRSTAKVEADPPPPTPPSQIVQPRVEIARPGPEVDEPDYKPTLVRKVY